MLYRANITFHDYFFFASFDYKVVLSQDVIHNYALMYAIWNMARFASRYTPHYREDLPTMGYYATPAKPIGNTDYNRWQRKRGHNLTHFDQIKLSYNSLSELCVSRMEKASSNLPISGSYYKFKPLTSYTFYLLTTYEPRRIIRIGKKNSVAGVHFEKQNKYSVKHGVHKPDHIVNVSDVPKNSRFLEGTVMYGFPTPLVADSKIESDFIQIENNKMIQTIQMPDTTLYPALNNLKMA